MKKASPPSSPDSNTDPEILTRCDLDYFGHLPLSGWSCLLLDTADKLAPMLGKEGMELYYRLAQSSEAFSTRFEGDDEAMLMEVVEEAYIRLSKERAQEMYKRMKGLLGFFPK